MIDFNKYIIILQIIVYEVKSFYRKVPSLKQRLAGKSIPMEKYVVRKSNKFVSQRGRLIVPALVSRIKIELILGNLICCFFFYIIK